MLLVGSLTISPVVLWHSTLIVCLNSEPVLMVTRLISGVVHGMIVADSKPGPAKNVTRVAAQTPGGIARTMPHLIVLSVTVMAFLAGLAQQGSP